MTWGLGVPDVTHGVGDLLVRLSFSGVHVELP